MSSIQSILEPFGERVIKLIDYRKYLKLNYKLLLCTIIAFSISFLMFILLQSISTKILHAYSIKPDVKAHHQQQVVSDLQRYIFDQNLSVFDFPQIRKWVEVKDLTMISIYYQDLLIYESHNGYYASTLDDGIKTLPIPGQKLYTISFSDEKAKVAILYHFEHQYSDYLTYFNLILFFLSFLMIMMSFIKKKIAYMATLEKEIKILGSGNLNHSITIKGEDELSTLAQEIEQMREAFILRESHTHQMKKATNELMAGISHDLRTPLTTLIGYLDIVAEAPNKKNLNGEQYFNKARERAYQLKMLIDNLFEYFFVSTKEKDQISLKSCSGFSDINSIINDHIFFLYQHGFSAHNKTTGDRYSIGIHINMMKRIFDNLFSNIMKYGDPSEPIRIINYIENGLMILEIDNKILENPKVLKSTRLGLKTCEKIMIQHGGQFISQVKGIKFVVKLIFPLEQKKKITAVHS